MSKKKYFDLLPEILQTDVNKAFYDATYNQLFTEKDSENIDGYIGRRSPRQWDPLNDNYLLENTRDRTWHQLEPISTTINPDTLQNDNEVFYDDFINVLAQYGGIVDNQSRLFSGGYYTFCPPIDVDKFSNHHSYKWVTDLPILSIIGISDNQINNLILGQEQYTHGGVVEYNGLVLTLSSPLVFTSGLRINFPNSSKYTGVYFVEGVGNSIILAEELTYSDEVSLLSTPFYSTIARGSMDGNNWSRLNRWIHVDVIDYVQSLVAIQFDVINSKRPIIEFVSTLELYNFGNKYITDVNYVYSTGFNSINGVLNSITGSKTLEKVLFTTNEVIEFDNVYTIPVVADEQPYLYTLPMPISDIDSFSVVVNRGMTTFSAMQTQDWFTIEDQLNALSFRAYSENIDWNSNLDDIEGILPGDEIIITVGDSPFSINTAEYVWVIYNKQVGDDVLTTLYPYGTKLNKLPLNSVVFYHTLATRDNYVKNINHGWTKAVQQCVNQFSKPKFNLYYTMFANGEVEPLSNMDADFDGSNIFSYKFNDVSPLIDQYIGHPVEYKNLGQVSDIVVEHDLITKRYNTIIDGELSEIKGYYYFKNGDEYQTTWLPSRRTSKQRVIDNIVIKTFKESHSDTFFYVDSNVFSLSVSKFSSSKSMVVSIKSTSPVDAPFVETNLFTSTFINGINVITITAPLNVGDEILIKYTTGDTFYLSVDPINIGEKFDVICWKQSKFLIQNIDFHIIPFNGISNVIYIVGDFSYNDVLYVHTYSNTPLPNDKRGFYEMPMQLEANSLNKEVTEYSANELTKHFSSIIILQDGFYGDVDSNNNYRDTKRDLSLGLNILQPRDSMLAPMLLSTNPKLNLVKSMRLSRDEYTRYKDKVSSYANQIESEYTNREYGNQVKVDSIVKDVVSRMSNSTYYNGAFANNNMFAHSDFFYEQTFQSYTIPNGITLELAGGIDLNNYDNQIYVYKGSLDEISGEFIISNNVCCLVGIDYEITNQNPIQINIKNHIIGEDVLVRVYNGAISSYMPSTPSKNGMAPTFVPTLKLDDTYATPMYVVVGHDGSISPIQKSKETIITDYSTIEINYDALNGTTYVLDHHGLKTGQIIIFGGVGYTNGHEIGKQYYVIKSLVNTFKIASTEYNAYNNVALSYNSPLISLTGEVVIYKISLADLAILEIENRIYNGIHTKFKDYDAQPPLMLEDVFSSEFRSSEYSIQEMNKMMKRLFLSWKDANSANYKDNSTVIYDDWKTWNYKGAEANQLLPGNWKGIYKLYYDTIRPHTSPWEMLGFSIKPIWWDLYYSPWQVSSVLIDNAGTGYAINDTIKIISSNVIYDTILVVTSIGMSGQVTGLSINANGMHISENEPVTTPSNIINIDSNGVGLTLDTTWAQLFINDGIIDYTEVNTLMWGDLAAGLIRSGSRAGIDSRYARAGLLDIIPVNTSGELKSPHEIGIAVEPTSNWELDWVYGDYGPVEYMWRSSSEYIFTLQEILFLAKPAIFGTQLFNTLINVKADMADYQVINSNTYMRDVFELATVTGEEINSEVVYNYGYQNFITDYILFNVNDVKVEFGDVYRSLNAKLAYKFGGFTDSENLTLYMQSVGSNSNNIALTIPTENTSVKLYKSPILKEYVYSGVIIKKTIDNKFYVSGYDSFANEFVYKLKSANDKGDQITVGGSSPNYSYFKIGRPYVNGQIVKYRNTFHECVVEHTPSRFIEENWVRLAKLPTYGGINVTIPKLFTNELATLEYGTVIYDSQEVVDFLVGYGDWLKTEGWVFDEVSSETNELEDWVKAAKDFIYWASMNWGTDNVLFLNPSAKKIKLSVPYGYADEVKTINNNGYAGVLNQYGFPIDMAMVYVYRDGAFISVEAVDSKIGINLLRIPVTQYEHVLLIDNNTVFNDIVYDPLLRERQDRLKIIGTRTRGWFGKPEASGYLIQGDALLQNPETMVEALRYLYDDGIALDNKQMEDAAKHLIGFEQKSYLDKLRITGDTQFKFYKGMVTEKGTAQAVSKILRSEFIEGNDVINLYEEWAVKLAEFGTVDNERSLEFLIDPNDIKTDPQLVKLSCVSSSDDNLHIKSVKVINSTTPYKYQPIIEFKKPTEGTLAVGEVVLGTDGFIQDIIIKDGGSGYKSQPTWVLSAYDVNYRKYLPVNNGEQFYFVMGKEITPDNKNDQTILIDIDDHDAWVKRPHGIRTEYMIPMTTASNSMFPYAGYVHLADVKFKAFNIESLLNLYGTNLSPMDGDYTWVADASFVNKLWDVYKTYQVSYKFIEQNNEIGNYFVYGGSVYTYDIDSTGNKTVYSYSSSPKQDVTQQLQLTPETLVMAFKSSRFDTLADAVNMVTLTSSTTDIFVNPYGSYFEGNNYFWVDDGGDGRWRVYNDINQSAFRAEQLTKVNSNLFKNANIFDEYDKQLARLEVFDPNKNIIYGVADANITFKTDIDPANYEFVTEIDTSKSTAMFADNNVGALWWDLSTCRYIDYEQGDLDYKRDNWGRLFDGSSIDIYEWVKSVDTPANYKGVGTPKSTQLYSSVTVQNYETGLYSIVYYFWVKNVTIIPNNVKNRTLSAASITSLLQNPSSSGVKWFAFIDNDAFLFNNIDDITHGSKVVMQINYNATEDKEQQHVEWKLLRENDPNEIIPTSLWNKLVDSLSELDRIGNIVPDPNLSEREKIGINIRPRQTMISNVSEARRNLAYALNITLNGFNMKDSGINWDATFAPSKYWSYVDWFETGFTKLNTVPVKQVNEYKEDIIFSGVSDGDIVKQYEKGNSTWYQITSVENRTLNVVRRELCAININDSFFTTINDNQHKHFIRTLLNYLNNTVYIGEYKYARNNLFFSVINYVLSEHTIIDWLFKTTYVSISHEGQPLSQTNFYRPSTIISFLEYVDEVKPYQTKIREYNLKYTSPLETIKYNGWDFDSLSYVTANEDDQQYSHVPSSNIEMNPPFNPFDVPRIFKINSNYDAIQCGFGNKHIYIHLGESLATTDGLVDYLIFDVQTVSKVYSDGYELPNTFYEASIIEEGVNAGKVKIIFTDGVPPAGHVIKVLSGITFTHTMLEEARLFNSIGYKGQHYHISTRYKRFSASFVATDTLYDGLSTIKLDGAQWKTSLGFGAKVSIFGSSLNDGDYKIQKIDGTTLVLQSDFALNDETLVSPTNELRFTVSSFGATAIYDLKTTVYGQTRSGFGNFKFGKIPFGRGGVAIETDFTKHKPFTIDIGASNRILHGDKKFSNNILKVGYKDAPMFSDYCEGNNIPKTAESYYFEQLQQVSHDVLGCGFQGEGIDGEDYLYGLTKAWDSEPWDIDGEYPDAGWDRELTQIGSINPMAINGREYLFDYVPPVEDDPVANRLYILDNIVPSNFISGVYFIVIDNDVEIITEYTGVKTSIYEYDDVGEYKTILRLDDQTAYEIIPPVQIKVVVKPSFTFLSTGNTQFKIPYILGDVSVCEYVDYTVNDSLIVAKRDGEILGTPTIVDGGTGYTLGDFLYSDSIDGHGYGAIFNVTSVSSGVVGGISIINSGSGYIVGDTIDVVGGTGTGFKFQINAITSVTAPSFTSNIIGNDTHITLSLSPTITTNTPLVKSFVSISYSHENSNVFDNGEQFDELDASYFAEEIFDAGMTDELAKYHITESVVFNVDSNNKVSTASFVSDGTNSQSLSHFITDYIYGDVSVSVNGVPLLYITDYTIELHISGIYYISFVASPTIGDVIEITYKNNGHTSIFSADDPIHWDSISDATMFMGGHPVKFTHNSGFDAMPFDCDVTYRSKYLVPSTLATVDPLNVKVYLLEDSVTGITASQLMTNTVDYDIMTVTDYINTVFLVEFPASNYNDALQFLVSQYSDQYTSSVVPADFADGYSVVVFNDFHINPIEDGPTSIAHGHGGLVSNRVVIVSVMEEISFTVHYQEDGAVTYNRNSTTFSTELTADFKVGEIEIRVLDATILPAATITQPAVIWINNERLTYTNIDLDGGVGPQGTLQGVIRATKGTSMPTGLQKYNGGEITNASLNVGGTGYLIGDVLFVTSGLGENAQIVVTDVNVGGEISAFTIISGGHGYDQFEIGLILSGGTGNGAQINVNAVSTGGTYPVGERVFVGDSAQFVPNGDVWNWTNSNTGLATSTTEQGIFLRREPGHKF